MLERIVDAALMAFIETGYRQTGVADIAKAADVAPGTVYLYVDGKASLFELALRRAFRVPGGLDVPVPFRSSTTAHIEEIWQLLIETEALGRLVEAGEVANPEDPAGEFEEIVRDIYRWQAHYWRGIALIETCARDWPELDMLFYRQFRREALNRAATLLEDRATSGHYRAFPDSAVAAHLAMDTISSFALHRPVAPDSQHIPDDVAEETVVEMLGAAFIPAWSSRP